MHYNLQHKFLVLGFCAHKKRNKKLLTGNFKTSFNGYSEWCSCDLNYTPDNFLFHFLCAPKAKNLGCDARRYLASENGML